MTPYLTRKKVEEVRSLLREKRWDEVRRLMLTLREKGMKQWILAKMMQTLYTQEHGAASGEKPPFK